MPIRTPISTDVYNGFRRNETSLGEVMGAVQGIQGMVQNSRVAKREQQLTEDDKYLNDLYAQNFAGWDGRDPAEFQRRKQAVDLEVQKTKPSLFGKALGYSKTLEDAMYGRIKSGHDIDSAVLDNEIKEMELYKLRLDFNRDFLNDIKGQQDTIGKYYALVSEGKLTKQEADHRIRSLGIKARLPSDEEFKQDPLQYYDYLVAQDMKTKQELADLTNKEKSLGIQKSEKELEWYDRLQRATINQKNRSGTGSRLGSDLSSADDLAAYQLARKIGGVRGIKTIYPTIVKRLKEGLTIDEIQDQLRYAQQSTDFSGPAREGMQQIFGGKSGKAVDAAFDYFDDLLAKGDKKAASDYLRSVARKSAPAEMQKQVEGTERALEFIDEIESDLENFEANGGNTNIFSGKAENVRKKLGYVKDPEMRKIAEKIHLAIMKYRNKMSGAAFSVPESAEYKEVFPSTEKTGKLNTALIDAIKETFSGDVGQFYRNAIGDNAYNEFIGGGGGSGGVENEKAAQLRSKYGY
jgi:hypothetical protein